jgi:outer membrane lipoprotein carrier protein
MRHDIWEGLGNDAVTHTTMIPHPFTATLFSRITGIILSGLLAFSATAQSAEDIRSKVANRYESVAAMSASFVQTATSEFMDAPERFSGTLIFSGSKYRIQTGAQSIVTDGKTLWIHNRGERQVIINDYVEDETTFSLTAFLRQLDNEYDAEFKGSETRGGAPHDVVQLIPQDDFSQFKRVDMHVRRADSIVTFLEVVDLNEVLMTFELTEIKINPGTTAETFSFSIPADVEIIDLRN